MIMTMHPPPIGGCNVAPNHLYYSVTRTVETNGADGLALTEVAYVLHAHPGVWTGWTGPLRAFSLASLLQSSVLRGRDSAEAAGCDLPDGFGDNLVVTHGRQEEEFGYYKVSLRDTIRACELLIIVHII